VHVASAQLVEGDLLTGGHPDHLWSGDEHVALPGDDEDEVGDRR
jgi:hypothetical protein